jgi:hypothetical protein
MRLKGRKELDIHYLMIMCFMLKDTELMKRATGDLVKGFTYMEVSSFQPAWILIATWSNVTVNDGNGNTVSRIVS